MKKDSRKYYAAYEERYKTAHANGVSWSSDVNTPIVMEVIDRYKIRREHKLLEIGCGEGRDSRTVLDHGFPLMATDISEEAIAYCMQHAQQGDIVVLAGKGHEDYQEIKGKKYPMDERVLIREILEEDRKA